MILAEQTKRRRGCLRQQVAIKQKKWELQRGSHSISYILSLPCQILITFFLYRARFLLFSDG